MKNLFKYLTLILVIVSVVAGTIRQESRHYEDADNIEQQPFLAGNPASESDMCFSYGYSSTLPIQIKTDDRRSDYTHRHNFEFVKVGSVFNIRTKCLIQTKSINRYSSLTEPAHILSLLRRLII